MSFSRRYAKQRSQPLPDPELPLQEEPDESTALSLEKKRETPPRKFRFLGRAKLKEEKQQMEEAFKRRYTHQASRLNAPPAYEENNSAVHWQGIFWTVIFIALMALGGVAWHFSDQWFFPIKHVEVKGEFNKVDPLALQGVLSHYATGSLLFFSGSELEARLKDLPWVDSAELYRHWPSTLEVTLQQKQPVLRYGENQLMGTHGELFSAPNMAGLENLPSINGPEDRAGQLWQTYHAMSDILAPLQLRIWRLDVSPRLAYTLVLSNGVTLYLGSNDVLQRLQLFAKAYAKTLKARADQMQYADLRYNSGMAVSWKNGVGAKKV